MTKLRVLALHGYGQNAHIFQIQIAAICKQCKDDIEFVFVDGPVVLDQPDQPTGSLVDEDGYPLENHKPVLDRQSAPRAWCLFNEDRTKYYGLDQGLLTVKRVLEREHFDGIIGFSQGAALASYICAYLEDPSAHPLFSTRPHPPFHFAIFASGFPPIDPPLPHSLRLPTLHILGKHDTHIGRETSWPLVDACLYSRVEMHEGGHFVQTKATWRRFFQEWMCAFKPNSALRPEDVPSPVPRSIKGYDGSRVLGQTVISPANAEKLAVPSGPALISTNKWLVWTRGETIVM
ncbi:hypothetical protein DACRYDRAFT_119738, partial [Dacryopinax primogenitus]